MNNIVNLQETKTLNSIEVSEMINKPHNDLMKTIRNYINYLAEGEISHSSFFIESDYTDSNNRQRPCFEITKKGCEMIANKLTGQKGVEFTALYVNEFNNMQKNISNIDANSINNLISSSISKVLEIYNEKFDNKISELNEYYKPTHKNKISINNYIKRRLGVNYNKDQVDLIKERIHIILGVTKWEDLSYEDLSQNMNIVDESIEVIKKDIGQISMFDN